jgi:HAD superfamily hydrolase (TIGR01484 family)
VANVGNDVDISYSHRRLIEITPKGVNKKTALEYVAKQLKIPQTQVAYVGDSNNDAPALK